MVCKCCVVDCRSNYAGEERTAVFSFPKEESLRKIWITFCKIEFSEERAPEVSECIKIDKELHVKLFFNVCLVPLPQWFRQGTDCCLTRKSMLENFPVYLRTCADNYSSIFELLRVTSVQIYEKKTFKTEFVVTIHIYPVVQVLLQDFSLPSLSLLQQVSGGTTDAVKYANALCIEGKMSEDVCMIFDETYLQKSQ